MVRLTRHDSSKNLHRFYMLSVTRSLFNEWLLVSEWGRIGSSGTVRHRTFVSEQEAECVL